MEYIRKDKLDYLIDLALLDSEDTDIALYDSLDVSTVVFDKSFYKKRDRIVRKYKHKPTWRKVRDIGYKAAAVALALIVAGTITVAAIKPLRDAVIKAVVEWYDNYIMVSYNIPKTDTNAEKSAEKADGAQSTEQSAGASVVIPTLIEEIRKPTNLPEGVVEDMVISNNSTVIIDYYLDEELIYSFQQMLLDDNGLNIDNISAEVTNILINEYEAKIVEFVENGEKTIIWTDGEYLYEITSVMCEAEELKLVAESVK